MPGDEADVWREGGYDQDREPCQHGQLHAVQADRGDAEDAQQRRPTLHLRRGHPPRRQSRPHQEFLQSFGLRFLSYPTQI